MLTTPSGGVAYTLYLELNTSGTCMELEHGGSMRISSLLKDVVLLHRVGLTLSKSRLLGLINKG